MSRTRLIYGVGINDSGYVTKREIPTGEILPSGNRKLKLVWRCPFYSAWKGMITRCYSEKHLLRNPNYRECYVCEDWKIFSNFRKWMETQDWEGKHLDKDILLQDNKVYSANTCVFINGIVNTFVENPSDKNNGLVGCYFNKKKDKYQAQCRDPFSPKRIYLGLYTTEMEAHLAWKVCKHRLSCKLASSSYVNDDRVAEALRSRYI